MFSVCFAFDFLLYYKQVLAVIDSDYVETKERESSLGYQNNSLKQNAHLSLSMFWQI